jgi:hypothetical protein
MADADGKSRNSHAKHHRRDVELARQAGRQSALITRDQLVELTFSRTQITWRVSNERLYLVHHNVYSVVHPRLLSDRAHLLAALLSMGPMAFLSHRTAAALYRLRPLNLRCIELTVPGTGGRKRPGLTIHRTTAPPHPSEVRTDIELRVSSVPRLLVELAARETADDLSRLITVAVQKRLLRPDTASGRADLEAALARHVHHPGIARLHVALATYRRTESHRSQLELAFDAFLAEHPEIPDPQRNIYIDGWEIDRCWPEHRLVVELDGRPYHVAAQDMERDRIKDAALQRLGHIPLRFTDFRFAHDLPGILRDLRHFLGVQAA